ncbi:MAG TPA: glycosyltransferase family 9 protein [Chlamydiales bacterium]|nr:glycosyltransferase family 9 protein [Chlamydiales bacterium]
MKNFLLCKGVSFFRPPFHSSSPTQKKILIVSTTALGDTLWATPAIASLRSSFPKAYLACLTSPIGMEILKYNPHLNRLYQVKRPIWKQFFSLQKTLYREQFDTILLFHASDRLIFSLSALLGAKKIVANAKINKGLDTLFSDLLPVGPQEHEIARRLQMVEHIGGKTATTELSFYLQPDEVLPPREGKWIALHPGAKDSFKRWPASHFIEVGKSLMKKTSAKILITGTQEERPLMQQIKEAIPDSEICPPNLSLRSFAAHLQQMDLIISNDTGPFHLACALKKKAIALYAPTNPLLCGPYHIPTALAIRAPASCTPCLKRNCPLPFCLFQISPEEVIKQAIQFSGL